MEFDASEKSFTIMVAVAAFIAFYAVWVAMTWQPPIEARLKALRTRRMRTRSEHTASTKPSTKAASIGLMRKLADRLNLLRGAAADQTTRKLRQAAFRRVAREMQGSMPELASEFEITAIELTYLPDRQQALENMAERSDSPAMGALVNALRQTEKYGPPLAASLRILAQEFRQTRASKAEDQCARMPALMTVPLMVFILPTLITVLVAPAIMSAFSLT